jgi:hypothetical protein
MNRCAEHRWCRLVVSTLLLAHLLAVAVWADESAAVSRAATVNGVVISEQEFKRELERIQRQKGAGATNADEAALAHLKREALENLIIRELLYQQSVKQKIAVDTAIVDLEMLQVKGKFSSPGQFKESLQQIGMTETMVRELVVRGLAISTLIDRSISAELTVSDAEIEKYYQDHKDSHAPGVTQPIAEVREKIRTLVRQEKSITPLQRYVKGLRDSARVELQLVGE